VKRLCNRDRNPPKIGNRQRQVNRRRKITYQVSCCGFSDNLASADFAAGSRSPGTRPLGQIRRPAQERDPGERWVGSGRRFAPRAAGAKIQAAPQQIRRRGCLLNIMLEFSAGRFREFLVVVLFVKVFEN